MGNFQKNFPRQITLHNLSNLFQISLGTFYLHLAVIFKIRKNHENSCSQVHPVSQLTTLDLTDTLNLTQWGGVG